MEKIPQLTKIIMNNDNNVQNELPMNRILKYSSEHYFNNCDLVHEIGPDNTLLIRKWVDKNNKKNVKEYNFSYNYTLEQLEDDIANCFFLTSTIWNPDEIDFEILEDIYKTKLPDIDAVYRYKTSIVCTDVVEMLPTYEKNNFIPKTYYELFSLIGIKYDNCQEIPYVKKKDDK